MKKSINIVANSGWYLLNFRSSTIIELSKTKEVACLCPNSEYNDKILAQGAKVVNFYLDPSSKNIFKEAWSILSLLHKNVRHRPSLIFSFNPKTNLYTLIIGYLLSIPCVINVSGVGSASTMQGIYSILYNKLLKLLYKSSAHIFFQNSEDYNNFISNGVVESRYSEVLPGSGVNLSVFQPFKKDRGITTFLMASRLIKDKGVIEYLEASMQLANNFKSIKFILAGVEDTTSRSVAKEVLSYYSDNKYINYIGYIEHMADLLKSVDCVVLPSYYPEGTPRSLLEAAAAGKVIITTDTPGCRDVVIEGVNGFLVPPRDKEALEEAMEKVINLSDEKLAEMQANSRKLAEEKFDEQYVIQRYLDVAEEILANKGK